MRLLSILIAALAQVSAQNPSPMSDSTRPHPRVAQYEAAGRRVQLSLGTLYVPPTVDATRPVPLIIHFHGAPWLVEHHVREQWPQAVLVTVQIGSGSRVYSDAFAEPARFGTLLTEVSARLSDLTGKRPAWDSIVLGSFSAGYGAIRSILREPDGFRRIDAVLLADSLHASYVGDTVASRTADLPVDESSLEPFLKFAEEAAAGRKRMWITHSEVFPGTYASTTETADTLLRRISTPRRPVLQEGPVGMQQLSEAGRGGFHLGGYAGNSAPDHVDHLFALGDLLRRVRGDKP